MILPIHNSDIMMDVVDSAISTPTSANVGLVYEKYARFWEMQDGTFKRKKTDGFFKKICQLMKQCSDVKQLLEDFHRRADKIIEAKGGLSITLRTNWRFLTGIGSPHPSETGFKWDRNLGVPYLSGSSVKGAMRAWMKRNEKENLANELFGTINQVGIIQIFDSYPATKPELSMDILNTHYKKYYEGLEPPADYLSPNPVYFLAVAPNTDFIFRLVPREGTIDMNEVKEYLQRTADEFGFGAKTLVGYGQFRLLSEK